ARCEGHGFPSRAGRCSPPQTFPRQFVRISSFADPLREPPEGRRWLIESRPRRRLVSSSPSVLQAALIRISDVSPFAVSLHASPGTVPSSMLACVVRLSYCNDRAGATRNQRRPGTSFMFHYRPPLLPLLISALPDCRELESVGISWNDLEFPGLH